MKNIRPKVVDALKVGACTPQLSLLARRLHQPTTTIHYNIKRLEDEKIILAYKAVFDYAKIDQGFCTYVLITLSPDEYGNPERIGKALCVHPEIESVDIIAGDWEMLLKVRAKDMDGYYSFVKNVISRKGILKIKTLTSMKQLKTEFVTL